MRLSALVKDMLWINGTYQVLDKWMMHQSKHESNEEFIDRVKACEKTRGFYLVYPPTYKTIVEFFDDCKHRL